MYFTFSKACNITKNLEPHLAIVGLCKIRTLSKQKTCAMKIQTLEAENLNRERFRTNFISELYLKGF